MRQISSGKIWDIAVAIGIFSLCGFFTWDVFTGFYNASSLSAGGSNERNPMMLIPVIAAFQFLFFLSRYISLKELIKSFSIFALMVPFFILLHRMPFYLLSYVFCFGIAALRLCSLSQEKSPRFRDMLNSESVLWKFLSIALAGLLVYQASYASILAYRTMYLCMSDWGIFVEVARNSLAGNFMHSFWQYDINFIEHHFMPSFFLIFIPFVKFFSSLEAVFVFNALLLYGSGILVYGFARSMGLPRFQSFLASAIYMLYPSVANLNLTLFYGMHETNMFFPVFIGFLWLYEKKHFKWAFALFIFSLGIKETVGIFWLGWGIMKMLEGERRRGRLYAFCGIASFLIMMKLIIPHFASARNEYLYVYQYGHLGKGMTDVILSPLLNPQAFFGTVFKESVFAFMLLLAVPLFPALFSRMLILVAVIPQLAGCILRNNDQMNSILMHHQTETVAMLIGGSLLAIVSLKDNKSCFASFLFQGIADDGVLRRGAMVCSVFLTVLLANYFFGQSFYGLNSVGFLLQREDCRPVIEEIRKVIPESATIAAPERVAAQFFMRNKVFHHDTKDADYIIYDLADKLLGVTPEFHHAMLNRRDYRCLGAMESRDHCIFVFRKLGAFEASLNPQK